MWTYNNNYNDLYHYGVKGMKWGVRRTKEQLGYGRKLTNKELSKLKNVTGDYALKNYTSFGREIAKTIPKTIAVAAANRFIPGAKYAYLANTVYTAYKHSFDRSDYIKSDGPLEKVSEMKRRTDKEPTETDIKNINPRRFGGEPRGTINNCVNCSIAMEMRERGYDIRARRSGKGKVDSVVTEWFKGAELMTPPPIKKEFLESRKKYVNRGYNNLCNAIEKFGNGARGYASVGYKMGAGHAVFWKVEKGKVQFYDGQNPKKKVDHVFALCEPDKYKYARLDNCEVNDSVNIAVVSRKEKKKK